MSALPDITTELARIRGKLARRLYSPASEQDVNTLLELVTSSLAKLERAGHCAELWAQRTTELETETERLRAEVQEWVDWGSPEWSGPGVPSSLETHDPEPGALIDRAEAAEAKIKRQAEHLTRLQAEVMRLRADDAERKARNAEATAHRAPEASKPDEWGRTDLHAEMARIQDNCTRWRQTSDTPVKCWPGFLADQEATLAALRRADSVIRAQAHDLAKERAESAALRVEINDVVAERNQLAGAIQDAKLELETHDRIPAMPGVEHYTDTLAKLPNVEARLRWVLATICKLPHTTIEVSVPPDLLREALTKLEGLRSDPSIERDKQAMQTARIAAYGRGWEDSRQHNWNQGPDLSACLADYLRSLV